MKHGGVPVCCRVAKLRHFLSRVTVLERAASGVGGAIPRVSAVSPSWHIYCFTSSDGWAHVLRDCLPTFTFI